VESREGEVEKEKRHPQETREAAVGGIGTPADGLIHDLKKKTRNDHSSVEKETSDFRGGNTAGNREKDGN